MWGIWGMNRLLIATALAGCTAPVIAQVATEPAVDKGGLEEIVVTAQKRAQNLQDVPAAVSAFTPETLAVSGIEDTISLQTRTPGLLVSTNGPYGQPYIRGVGSDIINPGTDAPVAVFEDGAYQPRPNAAITEFFDIDRVEVLKGPQGTLYGRNASGGAISIVTHDPDKSFYTDADASVGNFARMTFRGALNTPVTDEVGFRLAAMYTGHDGYSRNLETDNRVDNENLWGVRAKLKYTPTDDLTIVLTGERTREHDSRNLIEKIVDSPDLPLPVRDLAPVVGYPTPTIPADPRSVRNDFPNNQVVNQTRANAIVTWELPFVELRSTTGYTDVDNTGVLDLDGTEINFSYDREQDHSKSIDESLQASSRLPGPFQWLAGLEYFHETGGQNFDARLPLFGPDSPVVFGYGSPRAGFVWDSSITTRATSGFIDGSYALSSKLTLNAGVRYSTEHKEATFLETLVDPFGVLTGVPGTLQIPALPRATFNAWTPKFRLEYRPVEDVLMYASATRGFKSGGFNLMNTGEEFQPEKIWSYEVGLKATWLDNRLRTNAAAFYYNYKDLQVNQFSGVSNLVTNAANSKIDGLEIEMLAKPAEALQTDLSIAYLDATYRDYFTHDAADPTGPLIDLSGNRMPKAPKVTVNAGLQYGLPLSTAHLIVRGEARYQSLVYFDQFDTPELTQGGFTTFNARLTYEAAEHWSVALFCQNLTDKLYRQSMVRVDNVFGTTAFFGAPRTYGIEFSYHGR